MVKKLKEETKEEVNKGGRPPKFSSVEELQEVIIKYFEECQKHARIPNKAGLCIALDIHRETYNDWKKNDHRFSDTIKRSERVIEEAWVQRLTTNAPTGAIFYLKNAFKEDYKDRHETDLTSGGQPITGFEYVKPKQKRVSNKNTADNKAGSGMDDSTGQGN